MVGVREWVRQWSITVHWDRADRSPWHTTRYQTHAQTPAELRRLVEAARRDPHVTSFRYQSVRVMIGAAPTHCPAGHPYQVRRVAGRLVSQDWVPCRCGGHHVLICLKRAVLHQMQQLDVACRGRSSWSRRPDWNLGMPTTLR
jgi:hypothetical protein